MGAHQIRRGPIIPVGEQQRSDWVGKTEKIWPIVVCLLRIVISNPATCSKAQTQFANLHPIVSASSSMTEIHEKPTTFDVCLQIAHSYRQWEQSGLVEHILSNSIRGMSKLQYSLSPPFPLAGCPCGVV